MEKPRVVVAQLGARRDYAVPRMFYEDGMLELLYTDIYIGNKPWLKFLLSIVCKSNKTLQKLAGRNEAVIPPEKVVSFDWLGFWYWWRQRKAIGTDLRRVFADGGKVFNLAIIKSGLPSADIIYGFESASLELFEYAKSKGIKCILDQTIAPRRIQGKLLMEEKERWNGWQDNLELLKEIDPLAEREEKEWKIADLILCGSEFVRNGIKEVSNCHSQSVSKSYEPICRVVPYGVDLQKFNPIPKEPLRNRPLRVLFAGEVGLRKGIPYLLSALRMLNSKQIEAKLAGKINIAPAIVNEYKKYAEFLGIVPRAKMAVLYQWADVFVLPSICEGSATATYEALASGIPVICTPNTGSMVKDNVDGHIVPIRNADAIASVIESYLKNPEKLKTHQKNAIEGREKVGLEAYKERLIRSIVLLLK
ncbi:MAG: glycosyltransferase family 4 protein [candidate division WOR-3 bacterium]